MAALTHRPTSAPDEETDSLLLTDLVAGVRAQWRAIAVGTLTGLLLGLVLTMLQPPRYTSTVSIWVRDVPATLDPGFTQSQRTISIDTEAQRLRSQGVLAQAGINDPAAVEVTAPPTSNVLRVRVTQSSAQSAQDAARALGEAYLSARRAFLEQRRGELQPAIDAQKARLTQGLQRSSDPITRLGWEEALQRLIAVEAQFRTARTEPGRIVRTASPGRPKDRNVEVLPVSLALLGGLAGWGLGRASRHYGMGER